MTDSTLAFVGTYTGSNENGVFGLVVDSEGQLQQVSEMTAGRDPAFLVPSSDGNHLYVATRPETGGEVISYNINHETKALSRLDSAPTKGNGTPCYCSIDATGKCVMTAQYGGGTVSIIAVDDEGGLGEPTVIEHMGAGPNEERQSEPHPHAIVPGPSNEYAYAPDLGADTVFVYDLDPGASRLEPAKCGHVDVPFGAGPRHLAFHPNARYAYLINELDSTVIAFEYKDETGTLAPLSTVSTLPDDFDGDNLTADIHVHPSGEYLYGSNRGHDSIVIYEIDDGGRPSFVETVSTRGEWPRNFAISPSGDFLFVENKDSNSIITFRIASDGRLEPTEYEANVSAPVCMRFV